MKVEEVQPAQDEPLEKVRSEIARDLVERDAARRLAIRRAEAALAAARAGKSLGELFPPAPSKEQKSGREPVKLGGQVVAAEETGSFNPGGDYVPRAGAVPGLAADAARAERGQLLPKVYTSEDAAVVGQVKERTRPDPARFPQAREEIALRLRDRRQAQVLTAWMKQLRDRAKIEVNEAFLRGEVAASPVDLE